MIAPCPRSRFEQEWEWEWETKPARRYVKDFSGPAGECTTALSRAGLTRDAALDLINAEIGNAIAMLRAAAKALKRGSRSTKTKKIFLDIFRVSPEFVPKWLKQSAAIQDRGDVVAVRCKRVADLLASGSIKYFCAINGTNCPDCSSSSGTGFGCSSWGNESTAPKNSRVVCLGHAFWDAIASGNLDSVRDTLLHEPFHIYFGKVVTAHDPSHGKFSGIDCIARFVWEVNGLTAPSEVLSACSGTNVKLKESEGDLFDWFPSWFPFGNSGPKIVDRRAYPKNVKDQKGKRDLKSVFALVLHQTGFSRGNHEDRYDGIPVHFVVLPNGTVLQFHDEAEYLWSSGRLNPGSVAVEFVGNFRSERGKYYKPEKFGCHRPTPEQIQAGRDLVKYLIDKIGLTHVLTHRQSSGARGNDPGPEIWYGVGQWAVDTLGLKDGGPGSKIDSGKAIPDEWRQWGSLAASRPIHSSSPKKCRELDATTP